MKSTKVLVAAVLVLSLLLAWSVMGKVKDDEASGSAPEMRFERIKTSLAGSGSFGLYRSPVPGGWLVMHTGQVSSITFVPDPNHEWK
jgi:predicted metal-binding membrane protein